MSNMCWLIDCTNKGSSTTNPTASKNLDQIAGITEILQWWNFTWAFSRHAATDRQRVVDTRQVWMVAVNFWQKLSNTSPLLSCPTISSSFLERSATFFPRSVYKKLHSSSISPEIGACIIPLTIFERHKASLYFTSTKRAYIPPDYYFRTGCTSEN